MNIDKVKAIAEMRRTDYFCDDEAADAIEWLIEEIEHYTNALWKATGDNEQYVNEYLEATK